MADRHGARISSFRPIAPYHKGGFVAAQLPWPTRLPQPAEPACCKHPGTWGAWLQGQLSTAAAATATWQIEARLGDRCC